MSEDQKNNSVISKQTFSSTSPSKKSDTQSQLLELKRLKKENEERIAMIKNRINNIHKQNLDCQRKIYMLESMEERNNEIKMSKMMIKKKLEQIKIQKEKSLQVKQEKVRTEKLLNEQKLRHAKEQKEIKTKIISDQVKNDKMSIQSMLAEYNSHRYNANMVKCVKTKNSMMYANAKKMKEKQESEEEKKRRLQVALEREKRNNDYMMRNLKKLEEVEEQCLKKFTETMKIKQQKEKLNSSMISMTRNDNYILSLNNNLGTVNEAKRKNKVIISNTNISGRNNKEKKKVSKANSINNSFNYKTPNKKINPKHYYSQSMTEMDINDIKKNVVAKNASVGKTKKVTSYTAKDK